MSQDSQATPPAPTWVRYLVLAWLCLLATVAYIHRGCLAVPAKLVQHDLGLGPDPRQAAAEMAQILSVFFLGYTVFQIPSGWLGDRWGTRRVLTVCVLLWSLATGWMGLASGFLGMWLSRLVNGVAQAGIFPCAVKTVSRWFPETGRAFPNGMMGSFMSVGSVIATALTGFLLDYMSWQEVFLWLSVPGLVCAAGFWWWFRDAPADHAWVNAAELHLIQGEKIGKLTAAIAEPISAWSILLGLPMILVYTQQFCRAAGYIFYLTWFPTFLQETRGVSVKESGYLTSMPLLGIVIGSAAGGALLDWILRVTGSKQRSRQGVAVLSLAVSAACVWAAYLVDDALLTVLVLAAGSIFAGLAAPAAYTITIDLGGRHVATVFSTMNMMGNLGAFLMPLVVVVLVDYYSWNETLVLLAGLYLAAAVCWVMIRVPAAQPDVANEGGR